MFKNTLIHPCISDSDDPLCLDLSSHSVLKGKSPAECHLEQESHTGQVMRRGLEPQAGSSRLLDMNTSCRNLSEL